MHQKRFGRPRFRSAGSLMLPFAVGLPMVLTGCSAPTPAAARSGALSGTIGGVGRLPASTSGRHNRAADPVDAAVLSAWLAAQQAFEMAALTADPDAPDLAATTIPPQLGISVAALKGMQTAGDVAVGTPSWGAPRVEVGHGGRATVRACLHDAEIVVNRISRTPVPGILGEVADESFASAMTLTGDGWKLSAQTMQDWACPA